MKRNMDLIRLLLFELEGDQEVDLSAYTHEQKLYHKYLLLDAGLAEGQPHFGNDRLLAVHILWLTWTGHDFLAAARDETRWRKVTEKVGPAAFDAIKQLLVALSVAYGKSELGLP